MIIWPATQIYKPMFVFVNEKVAEKLSMIEQYKMEREKEQKVEKDEMVITYQFNSYYVLVCLVFSFTSEWADV